tara:strand:- start:2797 stop:3678 length:882 start_codon:yes stop_codon:yes gene_type:complete
MNLNILINRKKKEFDKFYRNLLYNYLSTDKLSKAMIYGSMNGGKRIRPFLVSIFSEIAGINKNHYMRLSSAIECIHSYSLIHDDLPSMDNDNFRRGKLSAHVKFDEATAILAGDALHDLAFEILSDIKTHPKDKVRILLINYLSKSLGSIGLAGGQSLDLLYENKKIKFSKILKMYELKTGVLFSYSCYAPLILSNKNKKLINFASEYGKLFGLIFQITDDIIDAEEDFKSIGKTPGKDKRQGKSTLLSIVDKYKLKNFCLNEINKFINKNKKIFNKNEILKKLIYLNLEKLN